MPETSFLLTNALHKDFDDIIELFRSKKSQSFGEPRRKVTSANELLNQYKIHRILARVNATDSSVIGYAEITNTPYIPALPEDSWMDWLRLHYCCDLPLSVVNSCYFNTFIYNNDYNPELLCEVLCEIFYRENKLRYIITPQCPNYGEYFERKHVNYYCLEPFATVYYPKCFSIKSCPNVPKLYVVFRDSLILKMRYRRALPEDNDDITDIIGQDYPDLKEQLGEYYIAEELLSNSKNLLIVTEISHITAGFIWLNDDVNLFLLLENYDLEEFCNLLKFNPKMPFNEKHVELSPPEKNVFVIHLIGLKESHDPRRIFRFLLTSFAAYPDKDYCLLSLGMNHQMTMILLELLKYFIRVAPRPGCCLSDNLYITHRSAVYGDISLHPVRREDIEDIKKILNENISKPYPKNKTTPKSDDTSQVSIKTTASTSFVSHEELNNTYIEQSVAKVMILLNDIFADPFSIYKGFTIRCGDATRPEDDNALIGFVILRSFNSYSILRRHFYMPKEDEFHKLMMSELMVLKLHPLFHFQADVVFRELARLSNYWHFYHFRAMNHHCLPNDLIKSMQPLEPHRIKKISFDKSVQLLSPNANNLNRNTEHYNLYNDHINLLHDQYAAFENNLRPSEYFGNTKQIVILGFTDICKAFLRLMIFSWHNKGPTIKATANSLPNVNITVICSPGILESEYDQDFKCDTCFRQEDCWINFQNSDAFIRDVCQRMDVRNWIRFVSGNIKSINTKTQLIKLDSECEVYYETLLLMCGTENGIPEENFQIIGTLSNYAHINNRFDKLLVYNKLKILNDNLPKHIQKSIVVYGGHMKTYEFINFLIKHGIKGHQIHLIIPHQVANLQLNNSCEDLRIEEIARVMLNDLGVSIYERMTLKAYSLKEVGKNLHSVTFQNFKGVNELTLECDLFISLYETFVDAKVLEILKESNINIDSDCTVVDQNYQTSVANIYAIGNFIKHKIEPNHQYRFVSPQEAAEKIINILNLTEGGANIHEMDKKFSKPYYFQAQLPMDYSFIKVTTPKRYLANHLNNEYRSPMVTYIDGDFSRVQLNEHGMVEEIVVVTQKKLDFDFLKFFCGHHELLLNNLRSRWYQKDIKSFLKFFQEPWVELIMHNNFESLRMINKILINPTAQEVMEKGIDRESRQKLMQDNCQRLGITNQLEYALLEFIREHRDDFASGIALPEDFPIYSQENE